MREHLLYINGAWRGGRAAPAAAVSPSSGETFASVATGTPADIDDAVAAAQAAWPDWAAASPFDRAACCQRVIAGITGRRDELARALTEDQGKPLAAEAYDEVDELAEYFRMAGEDAKRREGGLPASTSAGRRILATRVPLGVVAVVSPWNWPYTMGAELFAPAMAAGNAVVWVPAPTTSACCAVLADVLAGAGLPAGVFNFVSGPGPVVGDALVAHPGVAGVGFVGSVETGGLVAARAAGKAQLLELGGNGPMVLLEDADLALAAEAALEAAYLCAGQSCTAGERFLVHAAVRDEFVERVVAAIKEKVRLGDPFQPETTMGPLNNEATAAKFDRHIAGCASTAPGALRRTAGARVRDGVACRADRAGRGHLHGDRAGGDLRAGGAGGRGDIGGPGPRADQRLAVRPDRRGVHRGPGARAGFRRAGQGRLGQHQRLDQPVGVAPAVRRPVRQRQRAGPGRRPLSDGHLHRAQDRGLSRAQIWRRRQLRQRGQPAAWRIDIDENGDAAGLS